MDFIKLICNFQKVIPFTIIIQVLRRLRVHGKKLYWMMIGMSGWKRDTINKRALLDGWDSATERDLTWFEKNAKWVTSHMHGPFLLVWNPTWSHVGVGRGY